MVSGVPHLMSGSLRKGLKEALTLAARGPWQEIRDFALHSRKDLGKLKP